jgi:SWI/SNF-related matrix-associated actin-dependent regulator of chromatin subfamily A member 5
MPVDGPSSDADYGSDSDVEMEGMEVDDEDGSDSEASLDTSSTPLVLGQHSTTNATTTTTPATKAAKAANDLAVTKARSEQQALLASVRESNAASKSADAQTRLNYLLQQGDVFSHFLEGSAVSFPSPAKPSKPSSILPAGPSSPRHSQTNRKTEEQEDTELLAAASSSRLVPTRVTTQPTILAPICKMHPYQIKGLEWMLNLHDNAINGVLADEMGLGKTLQTISLLAYLKEYRGINQHHLIVVPKSVTGNWIREINKWCPSIRAIKLPGTKTERKDTVAKLNELDKWDVVVTSYEGLLKEQSFLRKIPFQYLIIDEAHRIKNENSSLSKVVRTMDTKHRLLITGTPLQNNLHELWALLNFLLPDVFEDASMFDSWFNTTDSSAKDNVIKKLHTILRPFMLRRIKKDVAHALPPKKETKLYIGLTDMQRDYYQKILLKESVELNALGGPATTKLMNVLMQLRKVTNHPYLFQGNAQTPRP